MRNAVGPDPAIYRGLGDVQRVSNLGGAVQRVDQVLYGAHVANVTILVMNRQVAITTIGIDAAFFLPHLAGMLTHDEIRAELLRQIDSGAVKQADVARQLAIAPARISEVRKGTRRIQPDEMPKLAALLGMRQQDVNTSGVLSYAKIPHWGKVAQGIWLEQATSEPDGDFVIYDQLDGEIPTADLFAVTPEGTSMNLRFAPGTRLICRRVSFGDGGFQSGSYVIVERTNHDLREMTCKRVEVDQDGVFWLHSESSDPRFLEPWRIGKPNNGHHVDTEVRVIGKVIRAVTDFA